MLKIGDRVKHKPGWLGFQPFGQFKNGGTDVITDIRDGHAHFATTGGWLLERFELVIPSKEPEALKSIKEQPEKLDLTKPVQTREGRPVRILCTDGPHPDYPVVGVIEGSKWVDIWKIDGRLDNDRYHLINVPPKPETKTVDVVMHRSKSGYITVGTHEVGWKPGSNKVLARKTITITEGEGV